MARPLAAIVAALACTLAPAPALTFAQAPGPGAGQYVETLPNGGGSTVTQTPSDRTGGRHHGGGGIAPVHPSVAPVHTPAPASTPTSPQPTVTVQRTAPRPAAPRRHHRRARSAQRHTRVQAPAPHATPAKAVPTLQPASSTTASGGTHGFVWLAVAMAAVTAAVLGTAGFQRRRTARNRA